MKRIVLACALLVATAASAQNSVTIFGVMDATVARGSGDVAKMTRLTNSGNLSSRLGIQGMEAIGGGTSAGFWLEAALNNDEGTSGGSNRNNQVSGNVPGGGGLIFGRRSTVSVGGLWGEVRLGRDWTPQVWSLTSYDPFNTNGVGTNQILNSAIAGMPTGVRASNSISYLYGHPFNAYTIGNAPSGFGGSGFNFQAMYYLGENLSNLAEQKDGSGWGLRANYSTGALTAAIALSKTTYLAGDFNQNNVAASYRFPLATIMGQYEFDRFATGRARGFLVGTLVPVGSGVIKASYSRYSLMAGAEPTTGKWAIGYQYNLSKRSAVYATYAQLSNSGGATQALNGSVVSPNHSSQGVDIGVRHSF